MIIDTEKLIETINLMVGRVERYYCCKSEIPIGITDDGQVITLSAYSPEEAKEQGFTEDSIKPLIAF